MKTKIFLAMLLAVIMSACSDGPEDRGRVDEELINSLSRDGSVSTYERVDFRFYKKDNSKWKEVDYSGLLGFSIPFLEETVCFQDGCMWEPVEVYHNATGPYLPYTAWKAYSTVTGETKAFYVRTKFEYDDTSKTMRVGKHDFSVMEFTGSRLRLSLEVHSKLISWDQEVTYSDELYTYEYKAIEPIRFDGDDIMAFDSNAECYRYMVKMAREKFGRYINLDEVYKDLVYLENPILDLDEVEKWIDEYEQKYE